MLLTIPIVGFLKCSLIAALLKLCLTHQCTNRYSCSQENGDNISHPLLKMSKYSLLSGLPARQLPSVEYHKYASELVVAPDQYTYPHCQLLYRWNHRRKCEEMGHNAVTEQIGVEYY
jgi:hypothetical protein